MMMLSSIEKIKPNDLSVDHEVQRAQYSRLRVRRMAENYQPNALGVPIASRRKDGSIIIIDGLHRTEAAKLAGQGDAPIDMKVFINLTTAQEAALFGQYNDTKVPQVADRLRVRVVEGEDHAVIINNALTQHGWFIQGSPRWRAIGALEAVSKLDPDQTNHAVERLVDLVTQIWGADMDATSATITRGLGSMLAVHGNAISDAWYVRVLKEKSPDRVEQIAVGLQEMYKSRAKAFAFWLREQYNKNRRPENQLPA